MKYRSLYEMIKYLQRGSKLHIGVCFFGNYGNEMCKLPHTLEIHSGEVCETFKNQSKYGYKRCFTCRNLALKKALTTKKPFGGHCINGVYEYTHPVVVDGNVACVVFIGNIIDNIGQAKITDKIGKNFNLTDTMENAFGHDDLVVIAELIEGHIRILLKKYSHLCTTSNTLNENIKSYINSNLEFDINITQISEVFHYNKAYLGRMFKKENNMTVSEYINLRRIETAKHMLLNTNASIINISNKSGFNNVTYFNKVFKKSLHISPSQYRRKNNHKPTPN